MKILEIPKKTTPLIQPLNIYFNLQYTVIARKLDDHIRLYNINIKLAEHNNLIKMNSLIHNQLSSKTSNPMIQHTWF